MKERVIVTGGSGRIGEHVIAKLVERGYEVFNLDRRPANRPGAKFVYVDLARRELLQPIMEQGQMLIHMGEIPSSRSGHNTVEEVFGHNCTVGSLVFQLASELQYTRVLYTSTIQIYGFTADDAIEPAAIPVDETHPRRPRNSYAMAKVAVEDYARLLSEKNGLSVAVFRLPWVMAHEPEDRWFRWIEHQDKIDDDLGAYVHAKDVSECFALALEKRRPGFDTYNLAAREVMFGWPVREALMKQYPKFPPLPETWGKYEMPYLWGKAREHFGWEPKWNFLDFYRAKFNRDPDQAPAK